MRKGRVWGCSPSPFRPFPTLVSRKEDTVRESPRERCVGIEKELRGIKCFPESFRFSERIPVGRRYTVSTLESPSDLDLRK